MASKEPQNTEEEGEGVKRAPIMGLLALIIIMMGVATFKLSGIMFPEPKKHELTEVGKYCLEKLNLGHIRKALEQGAYIRFTSEFYEKMGDCRSQYRDAEEGRPR